ncbi:probable protein arginine N-methyltransferase 3 [Aristolochia californica]|uniref:probable protein arginine N-methyltransferase 3 n=1 Tax=Aristolochia californica TaxID=171875 RepID=UPI0035DB802B
MLIIQNHMDQVYDIGSTVRAKFIPHSVSWFMGEVVQSDEFIMHIRCWVCGVTFQDNMDLLNHLLPEHTFDRNGVFPWEVEIYLKPFMSEDAFLHSFGGDEDDQDGCTPTVDREELLREVDIKDFVGICLEDENVLDVVLYKLDYVHGPFKKVHEDVHEFPIPSNKAQHVIAGNGMSGGELGSFPAREWKDKSLKVSFENVAAKEIKNVNENYFGAYSSFGIRRQMISDKVRTDSYRETILNNPSLMSHAIVLDVGWGTGILSLIAAQAGAILLDIATMVVARLGRGETSIPFWENVYGFDMSIIGKEVLEDATQLPIVDVVDSSDIVIGTSVLSNNPLRSPYSGLVTPASGKSPRGFELATWEPALIPNVKHLANTSQKIGLLGAEDIVFKTFDLVTMESSNVDFTSSFELAPKINGSGKCYGIMLWFETAFPSRLCKEMPVVLSTSPYKSKTHWSQTILTFREPIAISSARLVADKVGTESRGNAPVLGFQRAAIAIADATWTQVETSAYRPYFRV